MEENWYKNSVIYGVDVKLFFDANGDGIGDFLGLTQKLDYIKSLGFNCLWVLPFYPSGGRDNGYDVTDYYSIDPNYGSIEDFKKFIKEARRRKIRVIVDLVVHHTSELHPWFLEARQNPQSKYRNFYVWSRSVPKGNFPESVPAFPGVESSVWKFDPIAKMFYFHNFYSFQPDLNTANPQVQEEIQNIMKFWLGLGVSGFRIDAAKLIFDRKGKKGTEVKNADEFIERMHDFVKQINPEAVLFAEADVEAKRVGFFFGEGNRIYMLLNFLLNRYLFLGMAKKSATKIRVELGKLPKPPKKGVWVNFLRNLDELNIDLLTPSEKKVVFKEFGKQPWMRIYDRGIRRRFATMMEGNLSRMKMSYSLLFSLPGIPMIVYGDEIGMGDFLDLPEREAVRIPMQWNRGKNGGFSAVASIGLFRAALSVGLFRFEKLNVSSESAKKDSLLWHIRDLAKLRKNLPEIGSGNFYLLQTKNERVLGLMHTFNGEETVVFNNLSDNLQIFQAEIVEKLKLKEIFSDKKYGIKKFEIGPYGFRWFKVKN